MSQEIQTALRRVQAVFERRPSEGLHDDQSASVRWLEGTHIVAAHPSGASIHTDMPAEVGGTASAPTPG